MSGVTIKHALLDYRSAMGLDIFTKQEIAESRRKIKAGRGKFTVQIYPKRYTITEYEKLQKEK